MPDTLLFHPGQKAVITTEGIVEGWLAPFGGPVKGGKDLDGEYFDAKTDFALDYYPTLPILYGHGHDPEIGAAKVGEITLKEIRDKGVWVQGQLDKQGAYYSLLDELSQKGDLYWSSGAIAHLVQKAQKIGYIKQWPVAEATLSVTPSNPWATATIKSEDVPEPETVTETTPTTYTITLTLGADTAKEGRRNSATDQQIVQTMHDHAVSLGAECSMGKEAPETDPAAAGKEAAVSPAYTLTVVGSDVEQATQPDLDALKDMLGSLAVARAKSLTG